MSLHLLLGGSITFCIYTAAVVGGAPQAHRMHAAAAAPTGACTTVSDCYGLGDCVAGRCHCDPWASAAPDCSAFAVEAVDYDPAPGFRKVCRFKPDSIPYMAPRYDISRLKARYRFKTHTHRYRNSLTVGTATPDLTAGARA